MHKTYQRIRALRTDAGLTQKQIAQYLEISQAGYSKYETGQRDIPTKVLCALANYYHVPVDYIMERTDVKKPHPKPNP